MKQNIKYLFSIIALLLIFSSCKQKEYTLGDLTAPTNLVITTVIAGQDATNPNGDGSGNVSFTLKADNALSYKIDYDASDGINLIHLPDGTATNKYLTSKFPAPVTTFRATIVVYGKGGVSSTYTKDVTVIPSPEIVLNLTGSGSKTWVVDKSVAGHFGVGPWDPGSFTPSWWSAAIDEKVATANCFYTATYTFSLVGSGFTLQVSTPDGILSKGSLLSTLPGIPANGSTEQCNTYPGATGAFTLGPSTSGIPASAPSTKAAINLLSPNICIGYGSAKSEYEILVLTTSYMYLRVQGMETGNAWYIKMKPL